MKNEVLKGFLKEESYAYVIHNYPSFRHLVNASELELMKIPGIGGKKAREIKAILSLSQELLKPEENEVYIKKPEDIYDHLKYMSFYDQEHVVVICLNTKGRIISTELVSKGDLNSSIVHPREVYKEAVRLSAAGVVVVHNHPSNDPTPSTEDISITTRLKECGQLLGINLVDHVIIGAGKFVSLKERGDL